MPEYIDIRIEKVMVPKPVVIVIGTLERLTGGVIPHPVPALLMLFVVSTTSLVKSLHDGLGQSPTLHPMPIVIPGKELMGSLAILIAHDAIIVDDDALAASLGAVF